MAAMTTVLTGFAETATSRTYVAPGHTASKPRLVIQKRKLASGTGSPEVSIDVVYATTDATGAILNSKVTFSFAMRYPLNGTVSDNTAARDLFKEIIASDEFVNNIFGQTWIKG
jgi:hypothetical protein